MEHNSAEGQSKIPQRAPGEVVSAAATVNARRAVKAKHILTVQRSAADVFAIAHEWVKHLPSYEIVNETVDQVVAWKTTDGSEARHAGSVNMREMADGATEVRIEIDYEPASVSFGALFDDLTKALIGTSV